MRRLSTEARETAWRIAQAIVISLMVAWVAHAAVPFRDPCDTCAQINAGHEWVCWLMFCF